MQTAEGHQRWWQQATAVIAQALQPPVRAAALIRLHSQCKYALMAYSPALYKSSGPRLAQAGRLSPDALAALADTYRRELTEAFSHPATRANLTNALMHMQGYFKRRLSPAEKARLSAAVLSYREGGACFESLRAMLMNYARQYRVAYLCDQLLLQPPDQPHDQSHSGCSSS